MTLKYLLLFAALIFTAQGFAQTGRQVTGVVKDSTGTLLAGATVRLTSARDSLMVVSTDNGRFTFDSIHENQFSLVITSLGYEGVRRTYKLASGSGTAELAPIVLKADLIMLRGITISGDMAVRIKNDTLEYNAAAYSVREGAVLEDAIKKMPGLDVSKDGSITAQGKEVNKVRLNGKDYMAGDVKSLTRTLPADLVQNVQVIDDYGDKASITGIKAGASQKVLNINIKKDKNHGYSGQGSVGGGSRYVASANIFGFRDKRQITLSGDFNNTNTSLFDFSGEGRKGPDLSAEKQAGITTARAVGVNYRDEWGKKISIYGSYSFANNSVHTRTQSIRDNLSVKAPSKQYSSSSRNDRNLYHRANFNAEYKPDTLNYFRFSQKVYCGSLTSNEYFISTLRSAGLGQELISDYTRDLEERSHTPNYNLTLLYNHKFQKRGRNINLLLTGGRGTGEKYYNPIYNYRSGAANVPVNQLINADNHTDSTGITLSLTEPLGRISYLEFNLDYHKSRTEVARVTDTLAAPGIVNRDFDLSNAYTFNFKTSQLSLNYQLIDKKYNFTVGLAVQPSALEGASLTNFPVSQRRVNVSPIFRYVYNFSDLQAVSINYRGASSSPLYYQLQPVTDFTNASYPIQGNPQLAPEYNNNVQIGYNKFINGTGNMFFANLSVTQTDQKIVANTITYPQNYTADPKLAGAILTKYQNASGFYSASAYYVFLRPWAKRKYNFFYNGNIAFNNNISYLTDVLDADGNNQATRQNTGKNLVLTQGTRFSIDFANVVEADISVNYTFNKSENSNAQAILDNMFKITTLSTNGRFYFLKDWSLSYSYSKVIYTGFSNATNPNLLNTYFEWRVLRKNPGTLRFSVYDVFNENTGFSSSQNAYASTQSNVNRLGRYYLLSFTIRLQRFAGKPSEGRMNGERSGG
ncbi:TonB-dependent receptor [Pedobacter sp. PWIIR3]